MLPNEAQECRAGLPGLAIKESSQFDHQFLSLCPRRRCRSNDGRKLIVRPSRERTTSLGLPHTAPLLEEEPNTRRPALILQGQYPIPFERSGASSALPADDHPVQTS